MKTSDQNSIISIILPVRNESKYIISYLSSIFNQKDLPFPIELIISDGMSTDGTREVIKEWQRIYSNLILIDNPGKIVPTGMNLALKIANGNIIIRVDGHCVIAPDYVSKCVQH